MDVDELRWFLSVARTEHVTDAAASLHVSQPALSRAVARVERELGVALFDRQGRRLRLNRYGEVVQRRARRALAELDAARDELRELALPDRGLVRLGFLHSQGAGLVPALLSGYRAEAPEVRFRLRQGYHAELTAALREGEVDLVLSTAPRDDDDLGWSRIREERLFLAVPPDHRLAARSRVSLAVAAEEPFVTLHPTTELRGRIDELCQRAGFAPRIAFESAELATVQGLVAAGLGVAVTPRPGDTAGAGPVYVALTDPQARRVIGLLWDRTRSELPAVRQFRRWAARTYARRVGAP